MRSSDAGSHHHLVLDLAAMQLKTKSPRTADLAEIARALRVPPGLSVPAQLPPLCPGPHFSTQGRQSLPQQGCSWAGLQLHTALPCPAMGPDELDPPAGPCLGPVSAHPWPQGGVQCPWLALTPVPLAALLLAVLVGQALAARPCPDGPQWVAPATPSILAHGSSWPAQRNDRNLFLRK